MELNIFNDLLSPGQMRGICWTLAHSLWIGLVIAALAGIVLALTRRSSPQLRYHLFCSLMAIFVLSVVFIGIYELGGTASTADSTASSGKLSELVSRGGQKMSATGNTLSVSASSWLDRHSDWILVGWCVLFVLKSIKLIAGLIYVQRIRSFQVLGAGADWSKKVSRFAMEMGISRKVELIQSKLVKIPVTLGHFKPLVVLPIGLLFQLPADQIETILWHELAHIKRRDYLVNIMQKVIEAAFFFNPAVLWVSTLISEEREACCDDMVLGHVEQKTSYLAALVAFHSSKSRAPALAMGLSLRPDQLMRRLRRMVHRENQRLSALELGILVAGFILFSALISIPQVHSGLKKSVSYLNYAITQKMKPAAVVKVKGEAVSAKVRNEPDRQTPVALDSLAPDTLIRFKSIRFNGDNRDRANREMTVLDGKDNRYRITVSGGKITSAEFNGQVVAQQRLADYETLVAQVDQLIANKAKGPSTQYDNGYDPSRHTLQFKLSGIQHPGKAKGDSSLGRQDGLTNVKTLPEKLALGTKVTGAGRVAAPDKMAVIGAQVIPQKKIAVVDASADKLRVLGVISELIDRKIVHGIEGVEWFALTDEQLVVNGQQQETSLHQQLVKKYKISPGNGLFFGPTKVHGSGIIFDKKDL